MDAFVIHVERDRNINDAVAKVELVGFNSIITKPIFNNSDCSYCYRWTQNISGSWSMKEDWPDGNNEDANDDVTFLGKYVTTEDGRELGARSTDVDDLIVLVGTKTAVVYKVASVGFEWVKDLDVSSWKKVERVAGDKDGNVMVTKGVAA